MYRPALILILSLIAYTSTSVVKWLPDSSFNLPMNFKDGKLPCTKETVVFPETIMGAVRLEDEIEISGLILPEEGEIVLSDEISFGADPKDTNCTEGNAYYIDKSVSSWNQPNVWSSERFNKATPDAERMPCFNDRVEFPKDTKYTVILPDVKRIIKGLTINNKSYTTAEFEDFVRSQADGAQQFIYNKYIDIGVEVRPISTCKYNCPCQEGPIDIDCSVKFCPVPTCDYPIKPAGYCCHFCGGYINFDASDTFDMTHFKEIVEKSISSYEGRVVYHLGVVSKKVQLVVVDKFEYAGDSPQAINAINKEIFPHWALGKLLQISGDPLSASWLGEKILVSMILAIACMMSVYVYYYKFPKVRYPIFQRGMHTGMLSRLQRRTDSVVSLTRRDSGMVVGIRGSGFRNPLYNSQRGRVEVTNPVQEETDN